MIDFLYKYEAQIRLGTFLIVFSTMALFEALSPRRVLISSRFKRWPHNLLIVFISTLIIRYSFPIMAVSLAIKCSSSNWGLLNQFEVNQTLNIFLGVIFLDLIIYIQHVTFHAIPLLWRLHRTHHTDTDFDVTTGNRFHPIEIVLSMLIKLFVILAMGFHPISVLLFEIILNASAMFNHSNFKINLQLDSILNKIIVTPDMHRVHHSTIPNETNSNFGFFLSIWDRFFGTYLNQPQMGHENMKIGIEAFRDEKETNIFKLLTQPFRGEVKSYPLNKKD